MESYDISLSYDRSIPSLEGGQQYTGSSRCGRYHGLWSKYLPSRGFSTTTSIAGEMHLGQDRQSIGYNTLEARLIDCIILSPGRGYEPALGSCSKGGILVVDQTLEGVEGLGTTLGDLGPVEERDFG
eukprot:Gb_34524 [translate_table: standard]